MTPASIALARILKQEGTEYLFCFPTTEIIEAAAIEGIRVITCRTERVVTNMADAYTRIHNGKRIGVCAVQAGPGTENAFVGVAQAYADSSPILMLTGGATRERIGLPALTDSIGHFRGVTKWAESINAPERVSEMASRAFTKMRNGRRRPVLLELPPDVASQTIDETKYPYQPTRSYASAGDPKDVAQAISMLRKARRPIFYAGQGVLWGEASAELLELAELTGIPVMTTTLAKGAFPEDHALALGIGGVEVTGMVDHFMRECDLVFCLGHSLTQTLAVTPIPTTKTIVHCTADADDLHTEYRTPHAVIGDIKLVLRQLIDEIGRQGGVEDNGAAAEVKTVRDAWLAQWMPKLTSDETPISPYRVVWDLMNTIDRKNSIVTHDSGTPRAQMAPFYRAPLPRSYLGWGNAHQLGSSLGLIMGAKLAAPEKLAVAYMGDAAFGMCAMDLETAVRERIPVLAVVMNNSWMSTYSNRIPQATERYKVGYMSANYTHVAEGLGCHAERVDQPKEIIPAIRRAIAAIESGRPAVLEFMSKVEYSSSRLGSTGP
ncbi:MAG TPA: thiamine pyrophosphate-requiring protein [Candidatus Acidoferrales bacterium]|nr:thiamine pyrophosphate-requiring protein [Candidatus Acidoferrales bacterium]